MNQTVYSFYFQIQIETSACKIYYNHTPDKFHGNSFVKVKA
jgi:hypothetical protein